MGDLTITLTTASVLAIVFIWLSARVIAGRVKDEAIIGDAGSKTLEYRIRAHANFAEYTPVFLILLGLLEASRGRQSVLIGLAALFVLARLLHVPGMGENANLKLRQAGMLGTFVAIFVAAAYGLVLVFA